MNGAALACMGKEASASYKAGKEYGRTGEDEGKIELQEKTVRPSNQPEDVGESPDPKDR